MKFKRHINPESGNHCVTKVEDENKKFEDIKEFYTQPNQKFTKSLCKKIVNIKYNEAKEAGGEGIDKNKMNKENWKEDLIKKYQAWYYGDIEYVEQKDFEIEEEEKCGIAEAGAGAEAEAGAGAENKAAEKENGAEQQY